ncbi:MAG: hypothetical protein K2J01_04765 [Clostridiales bacterium]|nr:hypothetical protein [Clostridiales bacterium]
MKKNILKKIFSAVAAVAVATVMPLSAIGCGNDGPTWTPPQNTDEYNIPQDYARTYYEVFVRSFSDGNGDGIGDLQGLIKNLDYLNDGDDSTMTDLGVNGIWLMPINKSGSYHKYDVIDYYQIDDEYGTLDDFKQLVEECEKRGIWIQMDLVLNHTSNQHAWFKAAVASAKAGKRPTTDKAMKKYVFQVSEDMPTDKGTWHKVAGTNYWYLGNFSGSMPDLNLDNEEVRAEILTIVEYWLKKGVRSFRLDAVPWAYNTSANYNQENGEFWSWFCQNCDRLGRQVYGESTPDLPVYCYNVGEVWGGGSDSIKSFFRTGMSCFNYEMAAAYNKGFSGAVNGNDRAYSYVTKQVRNQQDALAVDPNALLSNFLSCHDNNRSAGNHFGFDVAKIKQAAALYLLSAGNAYIYYGEEIGAAGEKYGDNEPDSNMRMPFNWGDASKGITTNPPQTNYEGTQELGSWASQTNNENSILTFYRETIKIRNRFPEIARGVMKQYALDANSGLGDPDEILEASGKKYLDSVNKLNDNVAIYTITYKDNTLLFFHNLSEEKDATIDVSAFAGYEITASLKTRSGSATLTGASLGLPAGAVAVLALPKAA